MRIGVARPLAEDYEEEGAGESPPDTGRQSGEAQFQRESERFLLWRIYEKCKCELVYGRRASQFTGLPR